MLPRHGGLACFWLLVASKPKHCPLSNPKSLKIEVMSLAKFKRSNEFSYERVGIVSINGFPLILELNPSKRTRRGEKRPTASHFTGFRARAVESKPSGSRSSTSSGGVSSPEKPHIHSRKPSYII